MDVPFFDLKRQNALIKAELDAALREVFDSGIFISGEQVKKFEAEFSCYCKKQSGVAVANGTEALQISLMALGLKNAEIITVPNISAPTVSAILSAGAKPVLVDVEEKTMLLDPAKLEKAITKKTRAIVPVHLFGQCCDMKPITETAEKHSLQGIEDCAQAHGSEYLGKKTPFGSIGCFSFYPTKNLGAFGDAGMIVSSDEQFVEECKKIRQYGETKRYDNSIFGINSRMDELQAAFLRRKLLHLDEWNEKRIGLAERYFAEINNPLIELPFVEKKRKHVFHQFVLQCKNEKTRNALQHFLEKKGIGTAIHYPKPIHLQAAFSRIAVAGSLPVSESLCKRVLSLPIFPELYGAEQSFIIDCVNDFHA